MQPDSLFDSVDGVRRDALELLFSTARPTQWDFVDRCRRAEAEMEPRIVAGVKAATTTHLIDLHHCSGGDRYTRAYAHPICFLFQLAGSARDDVSLRVWLRNNDGGLAALKTTKSMLPYRRHRKQRHAVVSNEQDDEELLVLILAVPAGRHSSIVEGPTQVLIAYHETAYYFVLRKR